MTVCVRTISIASPPLIVSLFTTTELMGDAVNVFCRRADFKVQLSARTSRSVLAGESVVAQGNCCSERLC